MLGAGSRIKANSSSADLASHCCRPSQERTCGRSGGSHEGGPPSRGPEQGQVPVLPEGGLSGLGAHLAAPPPLGFSVPVPSVCPASAGTRVLLQQLEVQTRTATTVCLGLKSLRLNPWEGAPEAAVAVPQMSPTLVVVARQAAFLPHPPVLSDVSGWQVRPCRDSPLGAWLWQLPRDQSPEWSGVDFTFQYLKIPLQIRKRCLLNLKFSVSPLEFHIKPGTS